MIRLFVSRFRKLQGFIHQWWYGPSFLVCCALDQYVVVIPVLGMLVSSVFLAPRRWWGLALWGGIGCWLGVWSLGFLAYDLGLPAIQSYFPDLMATGIWRWAENFFAQHGVWVVFFSGVSPISQQPAVIIAAMAGTSLWQIGAVLLVAKMIKFMGLAYIASHAPQYLKSFKGLQEELKEIKSE
jgi:membrane protein YqaA with SNARE-associated domain